MKKIILCLLLVTTSLFMFSCKKNKTTEAKTITVTGYVKNINDGFVKNVLVNVNGTKEMTEKDGSFSVTIPDTTDDFTVTLSKNTYHTETYTFKNEQRDFGTLNISYSESSSIFMIGGERDISSFILKFYRTLDGIKVEGITSASFDRAENWVELLVSVNPTHKVRTSSEVQILLKGDGTYNVNNFADGNFKSDGLTYSIVKQKKGNRFYLDIPYEYLGIDYKDVIAFAGGVRDLTAEGVEDWSGLTFDSKDVVAEKPTTYVRFDKNNLLYSENNDGIYITASGTIKDENGDKLKDVSVLVDNEIVSSTNVNGEYSFTITKPFGNFTISFYKSGYNENSMIAQISDYPENGSSMEYETTLTKCENETLIPITGKVLNVVDGALENVVVYSSLYSTLTNADGTFTLNIKDVENKNIDITVLKNGYETETNTYNYSASSNVGNLNLSYEIYSDSVFTVGGSKSTNQFTLTFNRKLDGIEVIGTTTGVFNSNNAWIELICGTKEPQTIKTANDVQMFLYGDGTYEIQSKGSFNKNGITYSVYKESNSYKFKLLMPYSWLNIESSEIVSFAAGSAFKDEVEGIVWDGTSFEGALEALSPTTYVRFSKDNKLYRGLENEPLVILSGTTTNKYGDIMGNVSIYRNDVLLGTSNNNGEFIFTIACPVTSYTLTFSKDGYRPKEVEITKVDFESGSKELTVQVG